MTYALTFKKQAQKDIDFYKKSGNQILLNLYEFTLFNFCLKISFINYNLSLMTKPYNSGTLPPDFRIFL